MFFLFINIISILLSLIIKFIYYLNLLLIKILKVIFYNKTLRFLTLLFISGWIFAIPIPYMATIYFIYLVHNCALKFNIYELAVENTKTFYTSLFTKLKVKKNLENVNPEFIVINNLLIDDDSEDSHNINHLLITNCGVFNIKILMSNTFVNDYDFSKEYIFNNDPLREILPLEVPILNILLLTSNDEENTYYYNSRTPIIPLNSLKDYIKKKVHKPMAYEPATIRDILLESSLWNIDKSIISINRFIYKNKVILSFISITLLLYYFYINIINLLINYFS